jgi:hypothetical protein
MEQEVRLGAGNSMLESELLANEAASAAYFGRLETARTLSHRAVALAERAGGKEAAAGFESDAALREALLGNLVAAKKGARSALRRSTGADVQYRAALSLALAGDRARGRELADDLDKRFQEDTIVQSIYLPILRAQFSFSRRENSKAIEVLRAALPYELGPALQPAYFRGLAYLAARRGAEAETEFQKILSHPGVVFNSPIGALAHLNLGRALAIERDFSKARAAYQDFFELWRRADPDIPILKDAKAEAAMLKQ